MTRKTTFATPHLLIVLLGCGIFCAASSALAQGGPPPPPPPLGPPPAPPGNAVTLAKARLGKVLFWDEQMSSSRTVSCGSCHIPKTGGGDPRSLGSPLAINPGTDGVYGNADDIFGSPGVPLSDSSGFYMVSSHFGLGVQATTRRTNSAINAAYAPELFWDGRAEGTFVDPITQTTVLPNGAALESQIMGPPASEVEMGHQSRDWNDIVTRVAASEPLALATDVPTQLLLWMNGRTYAQLFTEAFGTAQITAPRIGMAIATYERTLFTNQTPFDAFLGGNNNALTAQEQAGLNVFNNPNNACGACHAGNQLTDQNFHYIGVRPASDDQGRFVVTGNNGDRGRMRTPSLRNLELRAPYMHNGRFTTIEEVIDFYNRGGDFDANNKDPRIQPLGLSNNQKADLAAFLKRPLTDTRLTRGDFPFDRPHLYAESSRVPAVVPNSGQAGTGNLVPMVVAVEPAVLGNPNFTLGVQNALGGAAAVLVIEEFDPGLSLPGNGSFAYENIVLDGSGSGNGFGSVVLQIPSDPAQAGKQLFARWYVTDASGLGGVAVSPLFTFALFPSLEQSVVWADDFETGNTTRWSQTVQ